LLAGIIGSATVPAKDFSSSAEIIDRLTNAAAARHRVRIRYYSLHRDALTERVLDPYAIYFDPDGATLKVIGYDNFRSRITPFAIDHIRSLRETQERFKRPAHFNLREFLIDNCFNGIHGEPVTVRLRASGVAARVFAERSFHPSQRVIDRHIGIKGVPVHNEGGAKAKKSEPAIAKQLVPGAAGSVRGVTTSSQLYAIKSRPESTIPNKTMSERQSPQVSSREQTTIEMRVAGGRGLMRFILSWGADVEVLDPPALRDEVAHAHREAALRYNQLEDFR
jgi:predicted DNA-binding transcriptional regulator YafY